MPSDMTPDEIKRIRTEYEAWCLDQANGRRLFNAVVPCIPALLEAWEELCEISRKWQAYRHDDGMTPDAEDALDEACERILGRNRG